MYPWWGKQLATKRTLPSLTSCFMGLRGSFRLISILALVHRGTSTTMLKTFFESSAYNGMSCMGEQAPPSFSTMKKHRLNGVEKYKQRKVTFKFAWLENEQKNKKKFSRIAELFYPRLGGYGKKKYFIRKIRIFWKNIIRIILTRKKDFFGIFGKTKLWGVGIFQWMRKFVSCKLLRNENKKSTILEKKVMEILKNNITKWKPWEVNFWDRITVNFLPCIINVRAWYLKGHSYSGIF